MFMIIFKTGNIEKLKFDELLNLSIEYHNTLLSNKGRYERYLILDLLHKNMLSNPVNKEYVINTLAEFENSSQNSYFEKYVINCIKLPTPTKESVISHEYQEALTNQIQYLRIKAITEKDQLKLINFLTIKLDQHFEVYNNRKNYDNRDNIFFLYFFFSINMFFKNTGAYDNILYKNFLININKKYHDFY